MKKIFGQTFMACALLALCATLFASCGDDDDNSGDNGGTDVATSTKVAVDLGLPSGTKWATCNVGASSPEDYGGYYAWGETSTKESYSYSNSTTYGLSNSTLKSMGIIDSDGNLTASYDAATVNWGKGWHTPTLTQIQELLNKCTWTWTSQNGVNGYVVTGTNGNSIFLPAAGYRFGTSLGNAGSCGNYWSSTARGNNSSSTYALDFDSGYNGWFSNDRYYGQSVRAVSE